MNFKTLVAASAGLIGTQVSAAPSIQLEFLDEHIIPSGFMAFGTTVGGLSGIDYDAGNDTYYAIADDRSSAARFYNLDIGLSDSGISSVTFTSVTTLLDDTDNPFSGDGATGGAPDPESIRYDASTNTLYWSSERDGTSARNPWIREINPNATFVRELTTPDKFIVDGADSKGVRNNLGFESLTLTGDGNKIYTANESALIQDGPISTATTGADVRIVRFDKASGNAEAEYVYQVDNIPNVPQGHVGFRDNGLVELQALDNGNLLAVERGFVAGVGNFIEIFEVDLSGATNVIADEDLDDGGLWTPASKTSLLNLSDLETEILAARVGTAFEGIPAILDNIEGITFGPEIDGVPTLILVSDDNFSAFGPQFTQFVAFKVTPVPVPAALPLLISSFLGLIAVSRRRRGQNA